MALLPVAEALARVLAGVEPLPAEDAALNDALGRVLTDDVKALRTQPPAAVSAMDGYAVRGADVAQAPVKLKLIGEVAAGHPFEGKVGAGEAARIFTGGMMPDDADTVVIQEITSREGDTVTINKPTATGRNVRAQGIDFTAGADAARPGSPPHRPRPDAGRRDELPHTVRSSPAEGGCSWYRRRAGAARLGPRPRRDRLFQRLCHRRPCPQRGRSADRSRRRARQGRAHRCWAPPSARGRRRRAGDDRWRLGRRTRPGAAGARRRRPRPVVLAGGAAARPAHDAWPARRHAGARRCPATRSRPMSAPSCSWCL